MERDLHSSVCRYFCCASSEMRSIQLRLLRVLLECVHPRKSMAFRMGHELLYRPKIQWLRLSLVAKSRLIASSFGILVPVHGNTPRSCWHNQGGPSGLLKTYLLSRISPGKKNARVDE